MFNCSFRRRGIALWHVILFFATILLLASVFGPMFFSFSSGRDTPNRQATCQSNLRQIMLGIKQYVQDSDGKFPLVATSPKPYGWAGALLPYTRKAALFQCPAETYDPGDDQLGPSQQQYTDYWFNGRLDGIAEKKIASPAQTFTFGDGNDGTDATDARYHLSAMPKAWFNPGKPVARHEDNGSNLAFADGHVKWFSAKAWKDYVSVGSNSFLPVKSAAK